MDINEGMCYQAFSCVHIAVSGLFVEILPLPPCDFPVFKSQGIKPGELIRGKGGIDDLHFSFPKSCSEVPQLYFLPPVFS